MNRRKLTINLLSFWVAASFASAKAIAEPIPEPFDSALIVVAQYSRDYEIKKNALPSSITLKRTVLFNILEVLKGPPTHGTLSFLYSANETPATERFANEREEEKWILFFPKSTQTGAKPIEWSACVKALDSPSLRDAVALSELSARTADNWLSWKRNIDSYLHAAMRCGEKSLTGGRKLNAAITYTVTSDGRVVNVSFVSSSQNKSFDSLATSLVNSMSRRPLLQFPSGVTKHSVEMLAEFQSNMWFESYSSFP